MDKQVTEGFCLTISIPMLSPPKQIRLPREMGQEIKKLTWNPESPLAALEKSSMPNQCKKQSKIMSLLFFVTVRTQNRHWKLSHRSAICWNYLGLFRDYGLDHIFLRNKTFIVFQDRIIGKEFFETSQCFNSFRWSRQFLFPFFYWLSDLIEIL